MVTRRASGLALTLTLLLTACSRGSNGPQGHATASAADAQAQALLKKAQSAAAAYFVSGETYVGFGDDATLLQPDVTWNQDLVAVAGQVSIRGESAQSVALVDRSTSGDVFCVGIAGLSGASKGRQDASAAAACSGGW